MPRIHYIEGQRSEPPAVQLSASQPVIIESPEYLVPGSELSRTGIKMPEFVPTYSKLWLSMADGILKAAGITNNSMNFGYVLTAISPRYYRYSRYYIERAEGLHV